MEAQSGSSPIRIRGRPNRRFWTRSAQLFGTDFGLGLEPGESDGSSVRLGTDPDSGTSKSTILVAKPAPFWLRFRSRPGARRTELGTPRIGMRAQLFQTRPRKRSGSRKYAGKNRSRQKCGHFSPLFPKIDENEPGGPKFGGAISTWGEIDGPISGANCRRMLRFWKIRGWGL